MLYALKLTATCIILCLYVDRLLFPDARLSCNITLQHQEHADAIMVHVARRGVGDGDGKLHLAEDCPAESVCAVSLPFSCAALAVLPQRNLQDTLAAKL